MLFNSYQFLLFFPLVALVYFVIPRQKLCNVWLLVASYYFYMCWSVKYGLLLAAVTVITYFAARLMKPQKAEHISQARTKIILVFALLIVFGVLAVFKYFNFAVETLNGILGAFFTLDVEFRLALPVGISFYTFQVASYIVDVYRGDTKPEKNFINYALYVSFFPQLVAGPIEQSKNFLQQFKNKHLFDYDRVKSGLVTMLWGYFLKIVIADRAALLVDTVYGNAGEYSGPVWILAAGMFALQIYCDFAGYSTIALGAGKVLGFDMTDNFKAPYLAENISDFWRRWHVSLYEWFRNYLYIPLGGSRKGNFRKYLNVLIVCAVSGLWHGANWTFLIWGLLNGIYQIIWALLKPAVSFVKKKAPIPLRILESLVVCILAAAAFVFFRASNVSEALYVFGAAVQRSNDFLRAFSASGFSIPIWIVFALAMLLLFTVDLCKCRGINVFAKLQSTSTALQWTLYILMVVAILLFGVYGNTSSGFIYFVF